MKLWEFLKQNMSLYGDNKAFTHGNITYNELIELVEKNIFDGDNSLSVASGTTKQNQAINILQILASGNAAVPIVDNYGNSLAEKIRNVVFNDRNIYEDLAFVMFTSGTTGAPKGVMLTDENIIENIKAIDNYFKVESGQKILISRPLVHISAITGELLFGLYKGFEIDFYEEEFQAKRLAEYIDNNAIEVFCATPTVMYHLSNYLKGENVKTVALSGERLNDKIIKVLNEKYSYIEFYNVYGLTECSPRVSALCPKDFFNKPGSVGKPIQGVEVKLESGELLVKSKSVMIGYLNKPELTASRLQNGYLHSGDTAKIDKDGFIYILGRIDEMIIRSGVNIYPIEIESVINEIENVKNCLVYGEDDVNYGQKICLKVVGNVELKQLRRILIQRLPPYLMPSKIEIVDSLPMTLSGKVKRK